MSEKKLFRVLSLDGGGAKGFYTLGILREIEALVQCPLHERFDLIFGTSTGSIIASMLALGKSVQEVIELYKEHVPTVMKHNDAVGRSGALAELSEILFKDAMFSDVKTNVGVVTTKWVLEQPMIFKGNIRMEHVLRNTLYALIECGDATLPDILRMLTDTSFQRSVVKKITNVHALRA